jgi:hypothetical protein
MRKTNRIGKRRHNQINRVLLAPSSTRSCEVMCSYDLIVFRRSNLRTTKVHDGFVSHTGIVFLPSNLRPARAHVGSASRTGVAFLPSNLRTTRVHVGSVSRTQSPMHRPHRAHPHKLSTSIPPQHCLLPHSLEFHHQILPQGTSS